MQFTREINRLLMGVLLAFMLISGSAAYWAITAPDTLLQRDDNPRLVEAQAAIQRGTIYDIQGQVLAQSRLNDAQLLERNYPAEAAYSALGYYSLRYGVGGAEAAYDALLSGASLPDTLQRRFEEDILHRAREGADIRLTLDLDVQQAVAQAMGERRGAAVVLRVPEGGILALVSQPTYNPNQLDAEWNNLIEAEGNPFFNRALQGRYQPGGMLQTPLLAAAILNGHALDEPLPDASVPVRLDDIELTCAVTPPDDVLTLREAYAYGCPGAFASLGEQIDEAILRQLFETFQLETPPTLEGFTVEIPADEATPEATEAIINETHTLRETVLGQGDLTINPLGMATLTGALLNGGNAPQPHALDAVRPPGESWQDAAPLPSSQPLMTDNTARRIRELMRANTQTGAAIVSDALPAGGHVALAYSGDEVQTWFIGFVVINGLPDAAVAIVLEDTANPTLAAEIAEQVLRAAYESLQSVETDTGF
jgi:peptidoglycan glycosyltransferase